MEEIILTSEQRKLLKEYRKEAFSYLQEIQAAKENLKDVVTAAADGTGLEKKVVSKFYNAAFKQDIEAIVAEAEMLQFLSEE